MAIIQPELVMRGSSDGAESRRDFFRATVRYGLLGCLTAMAAVTGRRARLANQVCVNRGICGECAVFASCGLPQALSAKHGVKIDAGTAEAAYKQVRTGGLK